jgi:translation initiation factor 3 subunit J
MEPSSKEDFDKFLELLDHKINKYTKSPHYVPFLDGLFRQLAIDLEPEEIKRLGSTLTALSNEKVKQQKSTKGSKKAKKAAKLIVGKETDDAFDDVVYDEYDDFM